MPTPNDFPEGAHLSVYLQGMGFTLPEFIENDLPGIAEEAALTWQRDVNCLPWKATTQTRVFDPPGPEKGPVGVYYGLLNRGGSNILRLTCGLLSVTELRLGVTTTNVGTVQTANLDYWLAPKSAPNQNRPYSYIEFRVPLWGEPNSITIAGSWGYQATLTSDVWNAVRAKGVLLVLPQLIAAQTSGLESWTEAGVTEKYGDTPFGAQIALLEKQYSTTLARYRRNSLT